jgi:DNA-directed RNA polymerase specialized sigma24 family protein
MVRPLGNVVARCFQTTRWSLVAAAGESTPETRTALAELCRLYWPPVYTFVRRTRRDPQDALDLTQSFFAQILAHNDLANVDRRRGRFRNWLLAALKHFLANERRRERAKKRGGGATVLSLDAIAAEEHCACAPVEVLTPEHAYDRRWAVTVLDHVMGKLEREHAQQDKR